MATSLKRITVKATAGKNLPVPHVLRLEDMLQQVQQGTVKSKRERRAAPAAGVGDSSAVQRLAAELEARLRELRAANSGPATAVPTTRSGGARKKAGGTDR